MQMSGMRKLQRPTPAQLTTKVKPDAVTLSEVMDTIKAWDGSVVRVISPKLFGVTETYPSEPSGPDAAIAP